MTLRGTTGTWFRGLAVVALLAGLFALPGAGVSAQNEETFEYDEDGATFSVTWDTDVWESGQQAESSSLTLTSVDGSIAAFLAGPELGDDLGDCLDTVIPPFEDGAEVVDATAADEPGAGEGDGFVYETRAFTISDFDAVALHVCFDIGGDDLLWVTVVTLDGAPIEDGYELLDGVEGDGMTYDLDFAGSGSDDEPAGTPVAGDGTPTADEDLATYESPTYAYTVSWDDSLYLVVDESEGAGADDTRDVLQLGTASDDQFLFVEGSDEWADADDCLDTLTGEISETVEQTFDVDFGDATIATDPDTGDDYEISDDDDRSAVAYQIEINDLTTTILVDCHASPDGDVIVGFTHGAATESDYFPDVYPDVEAVIDSLAFAS